MTLAKYFAALALLTLSTNVAADESDSSYSSYDSLVSELKASAGDIPEPDPTDWEEVALHAGAGIVTSFVSVTSPEGERGSALLKGFEARLGANLFSRVFRAELLFRNYASESLSSTLSASLHEFEMRLVALPILQDRLRLRLGAGFAARYMDVSTRSSTAYADHAAATPATTLAIGVERKISPSVSLLPELGYRSAIIGETFDKSAWDASLNLNATF